jgi:hypothetical protein
MSGRWRGLDEAGEQPDRDSEDVRLRGQQGPSGLPMSIFIKKETMTSTPTPTVEAGSTVNKTGKAIVSIGLILFSLSTVVWLVAYGVPANSLHQSAMSWSYCIIMVAVAALGLDSAVTKVLPLLFTPTPTK